jgi:hypothetical protein
MHQAPPTTKETNMNMINTGIKALTCGLGALAITTLMSASLVESTSAAPFSGEAASVTHYAKFKMQSRPVWFGQSQPAVLVD